MYLSYCFIHIKIIVSLPGCKFFKMTHFLQFVGCGKLSDQNMFLHVFTSCSKLYKHLGCVVLDKCYFHQILADQNGIYPNSRSRRVPSRLPPLLGSAFLLALVPVLALSLALSQLVLAQVLALVLSLAHSEPVISRQLFFNRLFEGTSVIGLILRSLWGLYKIHETLWFYLVSL